MSPTRPPFEPSPVELELCRHLQLPLDEVAADTFEVTELAALVERARGRSVERGS